VGGYAGDACNVGSSGHCQDLTMAWQLDLLARQGWGRARLVSGCVSRGCTNAQDWEKKKKSETKRKRKKKEKQTHRFEAPQKHRPLRALHVMYVHGFGAGVQRGVQGWHGNGSKERATGVAVVV